MSHTARRMTGQPMKTDSLASLCIFALLFTVFLAVAIVAQLLMLKWRSWLPGAEEGGTLLEGVRAAVDTLMPYLP